MPKTMSRKKARRVEKTLRVAPAEGVRISRVAEHCGLSENQFLRFVVLRAVEQYESDPHSFTIPIPAPQTGDAARS